MNKLIKIITLFFLICSTSLLSYKIVYLIGEKYFFDELFYKKSEMHGYIRHFPVLTIKDSSTLKSRLKDLRMLISLSEQKSQVLGSQGDNTYKIAIIGNSNVFGQGVKENERFAEILEKKLNKIRPTQVFIFALPGDNLIDNYTKFILAEQHLSINLYIICMNHDDLVIETTDHHEYPNENQIHQELKKTCSQNELISTFDPFMTWEENILIRLYPSFSNQYANVCFLEEIAKKLSKDNILFYGFNPISYSTIDLTKETEANQKIAYLTSKYASIIEKSGGYVISSYNDSNFIYEKVSKKEVHPSRKTHQFYAESLFKEIIQNPKWGFADSNK
jgi:hypothetical protein